VAISKWRYQRSVTLERHHIEHGTYHADRLATDDLHDNFRAAYALPGKAAEAAPGRLLQHAIEGGARQSIQRALRVEQIISQRHAHEQRTRLVGSTEGGYVPDGDSVGGTAQRAGGLKNRGERLRIGHEPATGASKRPFRCDRRRSGIHELMLERRLPSKQGDDFD